MQTLVHVGLPLLALAVATGRPVAQSPTFLATVAAEADASATETGGFLLAIPGVDADFVVFADGQLVTRSDGTARLSAYVQRLQAIDREFQLVLEFSGRVAPGDVGYPPAGSPVLTLDPQAYVPNGPVDPAAFVYYTQVTGTLTGLRFYTGARCTLQNLGAAQIGVGASNKNVLAGLACDLDVTVVQQPTFGSLVPTGAAQLRATTPATLPHCATHTDADPAVSTGPARRCVAIPGVADDYVFLPVGDWTEAGDGTAVLHGELRRDADFADAWQLSLQLGGRIDPGDVAHPPAGSPQLALVPAAYASQGGPIDPDAWRYYTTATGSLTGSGLNAGGSIALAAAGALQVGLGADQANLFFGLAGALAAGAIVQPTARTIAVTGDLQLQAVLATSCLLPVPVITGTAPASLPIVTDGEVTLTGTDLGWTEQAAIGPNIVGLDDRRWFEGHVRVLDQGTVALSVPQGLAPALYPVSLLNRTATSLPTTLDLVAPTTVTLASESDRQTGEVQHWVVHQGSLVGYAFTLLTLSESNLPSSAPGLVMLDIGNGFSNLILYGNALHDFVTGVATVVLDPVPASILGIRFYAQAAMVDLQNPDLFPLLPSNVVHTDY